MAFFGIATVNLAATAPLVWCYILALNLFIYFFDRALNLILLLVIKYFFFNYFLSLF